jgi:hypothetical protein
MVHGTCFCRAGVKQSGGTSLEPPRLRVARGVARDAGAGLVQKRGGAGSDLPWGGAGGRRSRKGRRPCPASASLPLKHLPACRGYEGAVRARDSAPWTPYRRRPALSGVSATGWNGCCAALGLTPGGSRAGSVSIAGTPLSSPWCVERGVLGHPAFSGL